MVRLTQAPISQQAQALREGGGALVRLLARLRDSAHAPA